MEIDLSLTRSTDSKDIEAPLLFKLMDFKKHFDDSIDAVNNQFDTADLLLEMGRQREAEDVWRSQVVFLASAFDFYMHELTRYGLYQIYCNADHWNETDSYKNITLPLSELQKALSCDDDTAWFSDFVMRHYAYVTMMDPNMVKEQLSLIGLDWKKVARTVFYDVSSRIPVDKKFTGFLNRLYQRRNAIAHQSDRTFCDAQPLSISESEVTEYVSVLSLIVAAIDNEIASRNAGIQ